MTASRLFALASLSFVAAVAGAAPVSYVIDQERSQLSITSGTVVIAGIFSFNAEEISPNGYHAQYTGNIDAELTGTTISFGPSSQLFATEHDSYLPGVPGSSSTPAPGSYAVHYPTAPALGFNFDSVTRELMFSIFDTEAHAVSAGAFGAAGTTWTIESGVADLTAGNPPQSDLTTVAPFNNSTTLDGTIEKDGTVETLTMPVKFQFIVDGNLTVVTLNYEGTIVAARSVPGCPGDLNHDGLVDDTDFSMFVIAYDTYEIPPANPEADLNGDGVVDDADFSIFVVNYNELICS